ncbi:type II toxin-antitoxin system RelE/ParE family toxin [Kineosporia sp. J2-2]|uniref:Type II toxin-antitoxin system RelE/ParE family toxin n=1 Tax=Kineosporia corallincola TaxID=2835133 RepID=A0ABS5TH91_9ACTN|nr:type II toxin-antitoxin system RelE/ParE family toxin [Kineosporia corallincola]
MGNWDIYLVEEVRTWIEEADSDTHLRIVASLDALADVGPGLGRPLVDTIRGSSLANLKELRVGTARIDPVRLRPVARQHPAGRRRQDRSLAGVVSGIDTTGRTTLRELPDRPEGGDGA